MKVNIISTAPPTKCGIGLTNHFLMRGMQEYLKTEDLTNKDIHFYPIKKPSTLNPFYFINLALKSKNTDVIHVQYNHDCFGTINKSINGFQNLFFYPILKLSKAKIVTTFHEVSDLSSANFLRKMFYKILNFCPLNFSDHIIVTTKLAKNLIMSQEGINKNKISVIPLGAFKGYTKIDKQIAKHMLGIPVHTKIITLFGFIDSNKGHDKILDILPDLGDNAHFLIAGDARSVKGEEYLRYLKNKINQNNLQSQVTFYGFVKEDDQQKIISASDVVVYPYNNITSSLALTTVISYKVPIVTSNIKPFIEFYKTHHCISICDVNNKKELISKIKGLLKNEKLSKNILFNQKVFIDNFNWEEIAHKTIDIYQN